MTRAIAIDGPAGAGKSTIAKLTAQRLSFTYVDTGALYRALAVFFLQEHLLADETEKIREACKRAKIDISYENGEQQVFLNGENITGRLRSEDVSAMASESSAIPAVRRHLFNLQRELAKRYDVVMDGRDIGTTILPDASLKIFLTANVKERARRRYEQLCEKGEEADLSRIEEEIAQRDHRDMTREESPLKQAEDAILLDTSNMTIEEVADTILDLYQKKLETEKNR